MKHTPPPNLGPLFAATVKESLTVAPHNGTATSKEPQSQNDIILAALQSGRRLTPIDAVALCQCWRLAARIYELRQDGHVIKNDGEKQHAVYYMEKNT